MKLTTIYKQLNESQEHISKAAGAIILSKKTGRILLQFRSNFVDCPLCWGTIGGVLNSNESPESGCKREIEEETGFQGKIKMVPLLINKSENFEYHNFLGIVDGEFEPLNNQESITHQWFEYGTWPTIMHFGLKELIEDEKTNLEIKKVR